MDTVDGLAAIGSDPDALEAFYREHLEAVQRFVARRVESPVASHHRSASRAVRAAGRVPARDVLDEDATERIIARIDSQREARTLYRSLASLPERQRAVVELVAVDGLPLGEAAAALGISAGNARVLYHRARRRLARASRQPLSDLHEVTS